VGPHGREIGLVTAVGLAGLYGLSLVIDARGPLFDGAFIVDGLAVFLKQVFLLATLLAVIGGLGRPDSAEDRRALEYHVLMLAALLGMMMLASARELVLLFVAFELMSIPLYILAGTLKQLGPEAALKFFLVGSLSTAFLAYGLSFVYGVTGGTRLDLVARAMGAGDPLLILGLFLILGGIGFKIAAFPFHMWVPDTYEAAATPFVAWLSVAPKRGLRRGARVFIEHVGPPAEALGGRGRAPGRAHHRGRQPDGHPADGREAAPALFRHRAHRLLLGVAALSPRAWRCCSSTWWPTCSRTWGPSCGGGRGAGRGLVRAPHLPGLAQRSPVLALAMLLFLLSLGGIPFVVGFWAKLYVPGQPPERASTGWSCWRRC
jgi:NADH-quinone oxidoreductase subunit N